MESFRDIFGVLRQGKGKSWYPEKASKAKDSTAETWREWLCFQEVVAILTEY